MTSITSRERDAFMPRPPAGLRSGMVLAIIAHVLLLVALSVGVSWKVSPPTGIEAELWAATPQAAAPRAAEVEPTPPPTRPTPTVTATKPPPEPPKPPPKEAEPEPDAQIAIDKAKRAEQSKRTLAAEKQADKKEAEKLAKQRKAEEADKLAEQRRKTDLAAKKRTDTNDAALAAAREKQMQRIAGMAGATGAPTATGTAAQSSGPSADYIGRIKGRIRPNVSFPDTLAGNPAVEIEIKLAPSGRIISSRVTKRSGVPEWDEAVLRAIERTEMLPRDEAGKVAPSMTIVYQLRE
jgi:colicin import membrane protein